MATKYCFNYFLTWKIYDLFLLMSLDFIYSSHSDKKKISLILPENQAPSIAVTYDFSSEADFHLEIG